MDELTDKQRLFVTHYLACLNATEAAARAGYAGDRPTLATVGYENLRKPEIRAAIDAQFAELTMPRNEILGRLTEQARGDLSDFLTVSGRGVTLDLKKALAAGKGHLIKKYAKTKQGVTIELHDVQAALSKLGEYQRLWGKHVTLNLDLSQFTDAELDDLDAGADPIALLARRSHREVEP